MSTTQAIELEAVQPVGKRVLIRREAPKTQTKAGIHLPGGMVIPTLIGRILALSPQVEADSDFANLRVYDRVLFHPAAQVPVDFEPGDNPLVVVPVTDIVAIIARGTK